MMSSVKLESRKFLLSLNYMLSPCGGIIVYSEIKEEDRWQILIMIREQGV